MSADIGPVSDDEPIEIENEFGHMLVISGRWMVDSRLTLKARGLIALIMCHDPGWATMDKVVAATQEGRDAVRNAVLELRRYGYLVHSQERSNGGTFADGHYELRDPFNNWGVSW